MAITNKLSVFLMKSVRFVGEISTTAEWLIKTQDCLNRFISM